MHANDEKRNQKIYSLISLFAICA